MPFTLLKPDGIDLSQTFAFTGTVTGAGGGKLLQILKTERSSSIYRTATTYDTVFSQAITPSATSSKVYVICSIAYNLYENGTTNNAAGDFKLYANFGGSDTTYARNTVQATSNVSGDSTDQFNSTHTFAALFSPSTTSAVTVKVDQKASRGRIGTLGLNGGEYASMMQVMEIGA